MADLIERLKELDAKATDGPWTGHMRKAEDMGPGDHRFHIGAPSIPHTVGGVDGSGDAAAVLALRNALPALIEYVQAAEQNIGALKTVLLLTDTKEPSCVDGYEQAKANLESALKGGQ